jgi:hypothetical protein
MIYVITGLTVSGGLAGNELQYAGSLKLNLQLFNQDLSVAWCQRLR